MTIILRLLAYICVYWLIIGMGISFAQVTVPKDSSIPTLCANTTIPTTNTISGVIGPTAFTTTCTIKAAQQIPGTSVILYVGGAYKSGTGETAQGRVQFTQSGTPAPTTDTAIINTGALSGIAASSANSSWWGEVRITFLTSTSIEVQGNLMFQATAGNVWVPILNTSPFTITANQDMVLYLSVQWSSTSAADSMQLRTMVGK